MELLINNPKIINNSINDISLISCLLNSISIYTDNYSLTIDIKIYNPYRKENLTLKFISVSEYQFYYNDKHIFYNIADYKILKNKEDKFYISFDPDQSIVGVSENDQDFIISDELNLIISKNS